MKRKGRGDREQRVMIESGKGEWEAAEWGKEERE